MGISYEMVNVARNMDSWVVSECRRCGEEENASDLRWFFEAKMFMCHRCFISVLSSGNINKRWYKSPSLEKTLKAEG